MLFTAIIIVHVGPIILIQGKGFVFLQSSNQEKNEVSYIYIYVFLVEFFFFFKCFWLSYCVTQSKGPHECGEGELP